MTSGGADTVAALLKSVAPCPAGRIAVKSSQGALACGGLPPVYDWPARRLTEIANHGSLPRRLR